MKINTALFASIALLLVTGAFLRFFKYSLTPQTLEKATYLLIPETVLVMILLLLKIWRR